MFARLSPPPLWNRSPDFASIGTHPDLSAVEPCQCGDQPLGGKPVTPNSAADLKFSTKAARELLPYGCRKASQSTRLFFTCSSPMAQGHEWIYRDTQGLIFVPLQCDTDMENPKFLFRCGCCIIDINFARKLVDCFGAYPGLHNRASFNQAHEHVLFAHRRADACV